jgi:GH24 family phage-related lysozyme (muramidase)
MNLQTFIEDGLDHPISNAQTDSDLVQDIQHNLERLGFNPGSINGIWSPKTQDAFTRFKAANQLFSSDFTVRVAQALLQPLPKLNQEPVAARTPKAPVTAGASAQRPAPPPPPSRLHNFAPPPPPSLISKASATKPLQQHINREGLNIIKECEGLTLEASLCLAGVPIIGYNSTVEVKLGQTITAEQAEMLLLKDLQRFEAAVSKLVTVPLSSNQFSALVSFVFNVGCAAFKTSTLLKQLNEGHYEEAAEQLLQWDKAGREFWPELTRRRHLERALFLKP